MRNSPRAFTLGILLSLSASIAAQQDAPQESADSSASQARSEQQDSAPPPGQRLPHWLRKAGEAYEAGDTEGWVDATKKLHQLRPYNQDFMRHLVIGNARLGNLSEAFNMMLKMQQQGLAVDWDEIDAVEPLRGHDLYDHLSELMHEAGQPFGDFEVYSRLDADYAMPEAMAMDRSADRMYVGTVRDGLILTSADGEGWETFVSAAELPQLQAVFDLAVDAERGHLWVATGAVSQFQGEPREDGVNGALLRLDLESGALQQEYPVSSGSGRNMPGSLALAEDGTLFIADMQAPVFYRLDPGAERPRAFFGHRNFTSLRGMALNADGSLLYVADYELGIFVIDTTGGQQAWQLAVPENFNAGGIDGVFWWDDHLVVIQNAISPQRVVRLELGEDGLGVTSVAPLAAAAEPFDTPTFGVMDGKMLYFLAGSHWHHVDEKGRSSGQLPEVPILEIDVDAASVRVVGESILEEIRRRQQQGSKGPDPESAPDGEG